MSPKNAIIFLFIFFILGSVFTFYLYKHFHSDQVLSGKIISIDYNSLNKKDQAGQELNPSIHKSREMLENIKNFKKDESYTGKKNDSADNTLQILADYKPNNQNSEEKASSAKNVLDIINRMK